MIDLDKYEIDTLESLDKENIYKIIDFLEKNNCDYVEELFEDYLDIFTFDYSEFTRIFNLLNIKYNNNLVEKIREDMNILEEFYNF